MTGEAWNEMMHSLMKTDYDFGHVMGMPCINDFEIQSHADFVSLEQRCLIDSPVACGKPWSSTIFFVAYTCVITFVILNLFVAVVLEGFDDSNATSEDAVLSQCVELWRTFDKDLTLCVPWQQAIKFMHEAMVAIRPEMLMGEDGVFKLSYLRVRHAADSRLKLDQDGTVSFSNATLAVLRLLMSPEEMKGVMLLEHQVDDDADNTDPDLLRPDIKNDIQMQVAALRVQEAFHRMVAAKKRARALGLTGMPVNAPEPAMPSVPTVVVEPPAEPQVTVEPLFMDEGTNEPLDVQSMGVPASDSSPPRPQAKDDPPEVDSPPHELPVGFASRKLQPDAAG
jgi:hypothetical protein